MKNFGSAVILAGGKSSRMGFDKQFLSINKDRRIKKLCKSLRSEFDEIIIVTNKPECYVSFQETIICDEIKNSGPLGGIHAGLKASSSTYAYFTACDMPNINMPYIRHMKSRLSDGNHDACLTYSKGKIETFNSFYSVGSIGKIESLLQNNRRCILSLVDNVNTLFIKEETAVTFSPGMEMFFNLNTFSDLKEYEDYFSRKNICPSICSTENRNYCFFNASHS